MNFWNCRSSRGDEENQYPTEIENPSSCASLLLSGQTGRSEAPFCCYDSFNQIMIIIMNSNKNEVAEVSEPSSPYIPIQTSRNIPFP